MFLAIANYHNDMTGMLFAFYILTIAAAEAAIGLAIFIAYFKTTGTILLEDNFMLKM
jgi:NADH-quinone oxidoreductase subunit K